MRLEYTAAPERSCTELVGLAALAVTAAAAGAAATAAAATAAAAAAATVASASAAAVPMGETEAGGVIIIARGRRSPPPCGAH